MVKSIRDCNGSLFFSLTCLKAKARLNAVRERITLACNECKHRNYRTAKNKKKNPERLELRKYCKFCRAETTHKETR